MRHSISNEFRWECVYAQVAYNEYKNHTTIVVITINNGITRAAMLPYKMRTMQNAILN